MALEDRYQLEPVSEETPERQFERRWALTVLDQALGLLRREYTRQGKATVFECLQKYLKQNPASERYWQEALDLNTTPGAVDVAVHRLRQRYGEMIRKEVARTVATDADVDEEYHNLRNLLSDLSLFLSRRATRVRGKTALIRRASVSRFTTLTRKRTISRTSAKPDGVHTLVSKLNEQKGFASSESGRIEHAVVERSAGDV